MRNALIIGIVLTTCGVLSSAGTLLRPSTMPGPCTHDKLKAIEYTEWMFTIDAPQCPKMLQLRAYACKKCKAKIVIQQAIEMPAPKKCEKDHIEWSADTVTLPTDSHITVEY